MSQIYKKLVLLIGITIKFCQNEYMSQFQQQVAPNGGDSVKIYLKRWSKRVITIDKIIILILGGVVM